MNNNNWLKSLFIVLLLGIVCLISVCCEDKEEKVDNTEYVPVQVRDETIYFPKIR